MMLPCYGHDFRFFAIMLTLPLMPPPYAMPPVYTLLMRHMLHITLRSRAARLRF